MANFCGRCGAGVVALQKFCPKCGSALTTAKRSPAIATIVTIIAAVLIAGGIGTYAMTRNRPPPASAGAQPVTDLSPLPGAKFEVTYRPETIVIDPAATKKSFEGVSADGAVLVFNTTVPAIRDLRAGNVLLLQGVALRKVIAIEPHGDLVIVATQPATLTDAITDGHIHWETPIAFAASARNRPSLTDILLTPAWTIAAPPPGAGSGSEGDWKFTSKATKEAGSLNLDVDIKGDVDGMNVDLTGRGHVQSFGLMTDIVITHGVIEQFQYVAKNLRGDVTIDFVATKKGDGMIKGLEIKLPSPFQAPLPIGGLPFVLSIGEAVIVKPALSGKNEVAEGHFKIKYGGGQGFSASGPSIAAEGDPGGENEITSSSSMGVSPFAYILAIAMPRVELTLGMEKATGFETLANAIPSGIADRAAELLSKTTIGSQITDVIKKTIKSEAAAHVEMVMVVSHLDSGPLALLPCKKTTFEVYSKVGYDVNALGQTADGSKELDVGAKTIIQQTPPNIRCGE